LLDEEFDLRARAPVLEHANVFQTNEGVADQGRVGMDEGTSIFDGHTSKTGMPSSFVCAATPAIRRKQRGRVRPRQNPKRPQDDFAHRAPTTSPCPYGPAVRDREGGSRS